MATLLDTLKQNLGQVGQAEAVADETGTVKQLLAAKRGIIGPQTALGPRGFSVAEAAAKAPAQQQLAETAQAAQLQATGIGQAAAGQAEEERQRTGQIEMQRQQASLQNKIQTENLLRGLEQNRAALTEDQRKAGMEQVAAQLRLQNDAYITNLQREGNRSRLQDDLAFDEQLKKDIAADNIALLKIKFGNQSALDADDRAFTKALAKIDFATAAAMARENSRFAQTQATIQGLGSVATTGIGIAGKAYEGGLDSGYQAYLKQQGPSDKPLSYTAWQNRVKLGASETLPAANTSATKYSTMA